MFNRLKEAISKNTEEEDAARKRSADVSFLSTKEVEDYRKLFTEIAASIQEIAEIAADNKDAVAAFVKEQLARKEQGPPEGSQEEEEFTLGEDLEEIKGLIKEVQAQLGKVQQTTEEVRERAKALGGGESREAQEQLRKAEEQLRKAEAEVKALRASDDNYKEILTTLRQQTELLSRETKTLQERSLRLERELAEKTQLATNLMEEKNVLLEMRNIDASSTNPEVESLRGQLAEGEKKLAVERTKVQQKEKEVETLKKKLEEDRDSLEKIADELKEKELKSKKIIDKYERSKTEIRKYREEKTEFIKKLNLEIASLSDRLQFLEAQNRELGGALAAASQRNEALEGELSRNEGRGMELESARAELRQVRAEQLGVLAVCGEREAEAAGLRAQVDQLQAKRKALLEALEKPINHEMRTLDRIIRALEKLYKDYIEVVFTQGNIIGFENKIQYILSNVCEIKEDLKL